MGESESDGTEAIKEGAENGRGKGGRQNSPTTETGPAVDLSTFRRRVGGGAGDDQPREAMSLMMHMLARHESRRWRWIGALFFSCAPESHPYYLNFSQD